MKYVFKMFFLVYIILLSIHFCGCNKQQEELTTKCIFRSSGKLIPLKTVSPFPDVR